MTDATWSANERAKPHDVFEWAARRLSWAGAVARRVEPLAWAVLASCQASPSPDFDPARLGASSTPSLGVSALTPRRDVEFGGCERVLEGPVCEVAQDGKLSLWMPESLAHSELWLGARRLPIVEEVIGGGYQAVISVDAIADELRLIERGQTRFRLALAPYRPHPSLQAAERAKNAGEFARALELLEPVRQQGSPVEQLLARGIHARVQLRMGQVDAAVSELQLTTEALFHAGQVSDAARDAFAALFALLHRQHRLDTAARWLERWREAVATYPLGRALLLDHDAMLASASGDAAAALHHYEQAQRAYERLGQSNDVRRVRQEQIRILGELGQTVEAHELHTRLLAPTKTEGACFHANFHSLRAWLTMLRAEEGDQSVRASIPESLAESERWEQRCGDPEVVVLGLVNRGLWALTSGDPLARRIDAELRRRPAPGTPYLAAWVSELEGRFALAERQYEKALVHFRRERLSGQAAGQWDAQLRALVGLAEVERARGRPAATERWLEAALVGLEQAQEYAPLGQLAHTHFASRQRAARRLVGSYLERGDVARAYRVALASYRAALALQARGTGLRSFPEAQREQWRALVTDYQRRRALLDADSEQDWRLTQDQLKIVHTRRKVELEALGLLLDRATKLLPRAANWRQLPDPEPGELWLLSFPTERGWVFFGNLAGEVSAVAFEAKAVTDALAGSTRGNVTHELLVPFEQQLRQATSVVILPAGVSRDWSFEQWPLEGQPLGQRRLAFASGLPLEPAAPPLGAPVHALVIADPGGDLPFAAREGHLVQQSLALPAAQVLLGERASAASTLALLEAADYLHFAGHARSSSGGSGAALLLAHQTELAAWELFGLRSIPRQVVLSACHAGEVDSDGIGTGWGLAQVFLALGAHSVLAPLDAIDDRDSLRVQQAFYERLPRSSSFREAFWATELDLWASSKGKSGSGFRLFVR